MEELARLKSRTVSLKNSSMVRLKNQTLCYAMQVQIDASIESVILMALSILQANADQQPFSAKVLTAHNSTYQMGKRQSRKIITLLSA